MEAKKAKTNLATELTALHKQVDKAKASPWQSSRSRNPSLTHVVHTMATGLMTT